MLNLKGVFESLDAYDAASRAAAPKQQPRPEAASATMAAGFRNEFQVLGVSYRRRGEIVPSDLVRSPELSECLLPAPRGHRLTLSGELGESDGVSVETSVATIRKLDVPFPANAAFATGEFVERGGGTRQFVAVAAPSAKEFRIEILGSITSETGNIHALHFAGDGAVLPEGRRGDGFVADMDGSIFRLHATATTGASIDETSFDSLNRVRITAGDDLLRVKLTGLLNVGETPCDCGVVLTRNAGRVSVKITETGSGALFFVGSAPAERVSIMIAGGLEDASPDDGNIIIFDRHTGAEIRRFPVDGRLSGLTWDGAHLVQAVWSSNQLLKIDPREGGGVVARIAADTPGNIGGIAFDAGAIVASVCRRNIVQSRDEPSLQMIEPASGRSLRSVPRPHAVSSGIAALPGGFIGAVNGTDQTPTTSDSALVVMDKATGGILQTIVLPRNFFIADLQHDGADTVLISVTEGLGAMGKNSSLWELKLR